MDGGTAPSGRRWVDIIATLLIVALIPALVLPSSNAEASLERPSIVGRTRGAWAGGLSVLSAIAVRFDRPVAGIDDKTFVLRDRRGQVVPATVTYDASRNRAELLPLDALRSGQRYDVTLGTAIRSSGGVAIGTEAEWTIRTLRQPAKATRFMPARAVRFAPGRVTGIRIDSRGRVRSTLTGVLATYSWATADATATIRGRSYYSIIDGKWAGYFVPAQAIVEGEPPAEGSSAPSPTPADSGDPSSAPTPSIVPSQSAQPSPRPATPAPTPVPTPVPTAPPPVVQPPTSGSGIVISSTELRGLPTNGPAWDALKRAADAPAGRPNLADMNQNNNVHVLAQALVYARTGEASYRTSVLSNLKAAVGTQGVSTLPLGREAAAYALAADLIGLAAFDPSFDTKVFRPWLSSLLTLQLDGRTLRSTHEERPNNWGTHASGSRAAIAAYLGDTAELARVATVFRGWVGERSAYAGFKYSELWWQANPKAPVGINPPGSTLNGHSVDGVIPDDQRRSGDFTWPPPCGSYPHEALDGALLTAEILSRHGYAAYSWGSNALLRAERWLHATGCPPSGDNVWHLPLIDARYGSNFWNGAPVRPGKNFGWTDWLYGS